MSTQIKQRNLTWETIRLAYLPNLWIAVMQAPQAFIETRAVDTGAMAGETMIALMTYVFLPTLFLLSLRSGFVAKHPLVGILGTWLAAMLTLTISCTVGYRGGYNHPALSSMIVSNFIFSLLGLFGGALGVGARYTWDGLPWRRKPHPSLGR